MGIPANLALLLLKEHNHQSFAGRFLSIGRQVVLLQVDQALGLVTHHCGGIRDDHFIEIDRLTRGSAGRELITDRSFYSLFSDTQYSSMDISDYEGADVLWDLCVPLPEEQKPEYDLIYNGSCLDNIFDPATALKNMSRLLKPGGRIIHIERISRVHFAYIAFSLGWFHDYYALNEFEDCKVYLSLWDENLDNPWDLYLYEPMKLDNGEVKFFGHDQPYDPTRQSHAIVIAEKGRNSTWDRNPVQFYYRDPKASVAIDRYQESCRRFNANPRPIYSFSGEIAEQHSQYRRCGRVDALQGLGLVK